jgi:hypothetical protein
MSKTEELATAIDAIKDGRDYEIAEINASKKSITWQCRPGDDVQITAEVRIMTPTKFEIWIDGHFKRRVLAKKKYDAVAVFEKMDEAVTIAYDTQVKRETHIELCDYLTLNLDGTECDIVGKSAGTNWGVYRLQKGDQTLKLRASLDRRFVAIERVQGERSIELFKFDMGDPAVGDNIRSALEKV